MKYSQSIEINLARDKVIELFDNPENMKHWQPGFISAQPLSGEIGQAGSKTLLKYRMGRRVVEMIETISVRNLPEEFSGTYEARGVWNEVNNFFHETAEGRTSWRAENEFRFKGFMKLMAAIMPGAFRKQSFKYMKLFKEFAESS